MKIIQINKFHYQKGGSETYYLELSRILEKAGHTVLHFSMQDQRNAPSKQASYFAEAVAFEKANLTGIFKIFYNRDAAKKLEQLIKKEKPDLAHLHNIAHQLSPSVIDVLKKYNIPIVQTLHDYKLICPNYKLFTQGKNCERCQKGKYYHCALNKCVKNSRIKSAVCALEAYWHNAWKKTYQKIDLFIAPSRFMKEACVRFGVPENKIIVESYPIAVSEKMDDLKISDYLLYLGRISEEKGIETLLAAMQKITSPVTLKIAGSGPLEDTYRALVKKLKLDKKISFLGFKSGTELEELMTKAKAIIIPSRWPENMPYALLESIAVGKVVIASRVGGMPEIIQNGENGFLFAPGNSEELAEKINSLEKADLENLGKKAREKALTLDPNEHLKKIMAIYQGLVSKKSGLNISIDK